MLKKTVKKLLAASGFYAIPLADTDAVQSLINRLKPRNVGVPLVRLGPKSDGGYLVPNDLMDISTCFSPGVADISEFEEACAELGMRVFLADHSVDAPSVNHDSFRFTKKFIGASNSANQMTLDEWIIDSKPGPNGDFILQMDIEGSEYESLISLSEPMLRRFRILVIEFHHLHLLHCQPTFKLMAPAFEKILNTHTCVHIHPNNCCGSETINELEIPRVAEFTFLRNDRFSESTACDSFPHPLDSDNTSGPPITLPKSWY